MNTSSPLRRLSVIERTRSRALVLALRGTERVVAEVALHGHTVAWANVRPYMGGVWVSISHSSPDFAALVAAVSR